MSEGRVLERITVWEVAFTSVTTVPAFISIGKPFWREKFIVPLSRVMDLKEVERGKVWIGRVKFDLDGIEAVPDGIPASEMKTE
jgi:hypothetical protein